MDKPQVSSGKMPVIPGYEIIHEIDRGGLSVVYKARQTYACKEGDTEVEKERDVALKVIKPTIDYTSLLRFLNGTKLMSGLDYPPIVKVFDTGIHEGTHFLSMEFIKGKDLYDLIYHDDCFNLTRGAPILIKALDALGYAHKHEVNHNDIKPQNILVDDGDSPHIIDFDLARNANDSLQNCNHGVIFGTLGYLSPERIRGFGETNPRSDIFSVGTILYELLTHHLPFERDDQLLIPTEGILIKPREINNSVPEELEQICVKALECDRKKRFQTAEEFSKALTRFVGEE